MPSLVQTPTRLESCASAFWKSRMAPSTSPTCCSASPTSAHSRARLGSRSAAFLKAATASLNRFSTIRLSQMFERVGVLRALLDRVREGHDRVLNLLALLVDQ